MLEIHLAKYKGQPINLGGVIKDNLNLITYQFPKASFHLEICNSTIYGSFIVPLGLGFSTPIQSLGDISNAVLHIGPSYFLNKDNLNEYNKWATIYSSKVVTNGKDKPPPYSLINEA